MAAGEYTGSQGGKSFFCQPTEQDRLTGLYNGTSVEEKINERLNARKEGVLLALDVDCLRKINDLYGYFFGDCLLNDLAGKLRAMFLKADILGRIGGDEFVVFLSVNQNETFAAARAKQVEDLLQSANVQNCRLTISITIGYSAVQENDSYQTLLSRAWKRLLEKKRRKKGQCPRDSLAQGIEMDTFRIRAGLQGEGQPEGAYFQDYETFKSIYRFVERRLPRLSMKADILLVTLTDSSDQFLPLEENLVWMEALKSVIIQQLRLGDTVTQYSSCQYLLMLADVWQSEPERIAERITNAFYQKARHSRQALLLHYCCPLDKGGNL